MLSNRQPHYIALDSNSVRICLDKSNIDRRPQRSVSLEENLDRFSEPGCPA